MRIAATPCQVVPPSQHVPSSWTAAMTARVNVVGLPAVGRFESDQDLVEDHLVQDRDTGRPAQAVGHPPGERRRSVRADRRARSDRAIAGRRTSRTLERAATIRGPSCRGRVRHPRSPRSTPRRVSWPRGGRPHRARSRCPSHMARSATCGHRSSTSPPGPARSPGRAVRARPPPTVRTHRRHAATRSSVPGRPAAISSRGSNAPVFTLPACAHTMTGPSSPASISPRASARIRPWSSAGMRWTRPRPRPSIWSETKIVTWDSSPTTTSIGGRADEPVHLVIPAAPLQHAVPGGGDRGEIRHGGAGREADARSLPATRRDPPANRRRPPRRPMRPERARTSRRSGPRCSSASPRPARPTRTRPRRSRSSAGRPRRPAPVRRPGPAPARPPGHRPRQTGAVRPAMPEGPAGPPAVRPDAPAGSRGSRRPDRPWRGAGDRCRP